MKNIVIVGIGYVGLSNAVLLAQNNKVFALDIDSIKTKKINEKISPLSDIEIQDYLQNKKLNLFCDTMENGEKYFLSADYIIISTPTNYREEENCFDTSSVESVLTQIKSSKTKATVVIKSTIPIGYSEKISKRFNMPNILFSPEFLREGSALKDNLYPSRIIVGYSKENPEMLDKAKEFADLLKEGAIKKDVDTLFPYFTEAESIKLFANTFLALRVAFFNELDTFAIANNLNSAQIIKGVSLDSRIGNYYNNPSFGYGGYCLPKDTKQLLQNYDGIPQNLIKAIIESNNTRKDFIVQEIIKRKPTVVGIYRLTMKTNSDNFRQSSILSIIEKLANQGIKIVIYEPSLGSKEFNKFEVNNNLSEFKKNCDLIIANRNSKELADVNSKLYSRDIYTRD